MGSLSSFYQREIHLFKPHKKKYKKEVMRKYFIGICLLILVRV